MTKQALPWLSWLVGVSSVLAIQWTILPTWNSPLPLFESWTVQSVHWLAAIPLAKVVMTRLPTGPKLLARCHHRAMIALIASLLASSVYVGATLAIDSLNQAISPGFWVSACVRTLVASLWVSCWLGSVMATDESSSTQGPTRWRVGDLTWSIAMACLLPGVFVWDRLEQLQGQLVPLLGSQRVAAGHEIAMRMATLNNAQPVAGKRPAEHARQLQLQMVQIRSLLDAPLPPDADAPELTKRTMHMLTLGMLDEAVTILTLLPQDSSDTQLLRALAAREQQNWPVAEQACRYLLNHENMAMKPQLYEILSEALVNLGRVPEAIQSLNSAIQSTPGQESAKFWLLLGALQAERGDYTAAQRCNQQALALQPLFENEVAARSRRLTNFTCRLK